MLKLQPIEFFLRVLPESFLFILAVYIFSQTKIDKKKYFISGLIFSIVVFIIRSLPINYGVHMILSVLFLLFITTKHNKIDVISSIRSIILTYLVQLISEALNILFLNLINVNLEVAFLNPITKNLLGIPSIILTFLIIMVSYKFINKKRDEKKK